MDFSPIDQLARAGQLFGGLIGAVSATQWTLPTPCTDWTVRDLVVHVVLGNHLFADALAPDQQPSVPDAEASCATDDVDLQQQFVRSEHLLLQRFSLPDALSRTITVPFGTIPGAVGLHLRITEMLVHGWDVAVAIGGAIGAEVTFPEDLVEQELAFSENALSAIAADRSPFRAPRPVSGTAPAIDRLVALLGREV